MAPGPKSMSGLPVWFLKVLPTTLPCRHATLIPLCEMKSTVFPIRETANCFNGLKWAPISVRGCVNVLCTEYTEQFYNTYEVEFPDAGVEGALLDELDPVVLDAQLAGVGVHRAPLQDADLALLKDFLH